MFRYNKYFLRVVMFLMVLILAPSKANNHHSVSTDKETNTTDVPVVLIKKKPRFNKKVFTGLKGTIYNPVQNQTKKNLPLLTANMTLIDTVLLNQGKLRYVALSRDLLKAHGGHIKYGDVILVESKYAVINGKWKVVDCMNKRWRNKMDFLFPESAMLKRTSFYNIKITVVSKHKIKRKV